MKSRQICLCIELSELHQLMKAVRGRVLPRYEAMPHFLGLTVIKVDVESRSEVLVTSFWDDGLADSEMEASRFISEIVEVTGTMPSRKSFDTLYAQVRDVSGEFRSGPDSISAGSASNSAREGPTDRGTIYSAGSDEGTPSDPSDKYQL